MRPPADVEGVGFADFIIDSGSSGTLITAELRDQLGVAATDGQVGARQLAATCQLESWRNK